VTFSACCQWVVHAVIEALLVGVVSLAWWRDACEATDAVAARAKRPLERQYKRTVSRHRSLAAVGAALAFVPLGIALVNHQFFNSGFADAESLIPAGMTGAISSIVANKINMRSSAGDIEEHTFYILWMLGRDER
jgi:hypothetical protein